MPQVIADATTVELNRATNTSGLMTLFLLTLRQHCKARRLLILVALFCLPAFFAILIRNLSPQPPTISQGQIPHMEVAIIFFFIPHILAPLAALLYASGMIQDELEDQTFTYLLVRPLPRWGIYLAKLLATVTVTIPLVAVFTTISYVAIYWGFPELWEEILPKRALQVSARSALTQVTYVSLFGLISLAVRQSLVVGVLYIALFEGFFANIQLEAIRLMTVMYYFRVLAARWLDFFGRPPMAAKDIWRIDVTSAAVPSAAQCVWILVLASLTATVLALLSIHSREFRVKTPEGS